MKTPSKRGEITLATALVIAIVGTGIVWIAKPKKLDGESRRAEASVAATARLESAHQAEIAAINSKAATVAASVQQIGVAAASAPASPANDYISKEVTWLSPLLPAPDARALLSAERRRIAVMEGRLDEAQRLYAAADRDRASLLARVAVAEAATATAQAAREEADRKIGEAAAANLALERRSRLQWAGLALVAVVSGWLWLNSRSLVSAFRPVVSALDAAYDEGGESVRGLLDAKVFDKLSSALDRSQKALIHKLRAKT